MHQVDVDDMLAACITCCECKKTHYTYCTHRKHRTCSWVIMSQKASRHICDIIYRTHLYGDIYSSPGLAMRQKQLLMCAFLGQANMPDELFGHALAVRSNLIACLTIV